MAILKIYNDIVGEDEKQFLQWNGRDALAFSDVEAFIASIPADDDTIKLVINCRGGSVADAFKMYDALRASGKIISAEVTGECDSSATILLCAARKDLREARPNARLLIHNPYVCGYVQADADEMQNITDALRAERERILDVYVERCENNDREALAALMDKNVYMSIDKAIELGFINNKILPISAKKTMSKKSIWRTLGQALGVYGMSLETANGGTLELKKDEGDVMIGDEVDSPDGEYLMPDGSTIVVEDGKVKEVKPKEEEETETETVEETETVKDEQPETTEEAGETAENEEVEETIDEEAAKDAKIKELEDALAERDAKIKELEAQLEEATTNAKSDDEREILNAVNAAGGREWLAHVAKSNEQVSVKGFEQKQVINKGAESYGDYIKRVYNK